MLQRARSSRNCRRPTPQSSFTIGSKAPRAVSNLSSVPFLPRAPLLKIKLVQSANVSGAAAPYPYQGLRMKPCDVLLLCHYHHIDRRLVDFWRQRRTRYEGRTDCCVDAKMSKPLKRGWMSTADWHPIFAVSLFFSISLILYIS
jgi:hypothetical protein